MKVLAFSASLRAGSWNRKLVELAVQVARAQGAEVDLVDFRKFDMPLYDGDVDARHGLPPGALALKQHVEGADALLIATPEYNYAISGVFKNAIDWVSRARPMPWRGKSIFLMSASPSSVGGIRGLWQTRVPLEGCGALVFPDMFTVAMAHEAFDAQGRLRDPSLGGRLETEVRGFLAMAESLLPVCGKAASGGEVRRQKEIVAALEDESRLQPS
jgi:NAD(P)H-dependent FMN reductase